MFKVLAVFLLGALCPLAFAPWQWVWLMAFIPGIYEQFLHQTKHPALTGFAFGLGFFGIGASWVFVSIHEYSDTPLFIALLITFGFVALLAGIMALSAWVYPRLKPLDFTKRLMIFPALWTLTEAFRGWVFTGFPWLYLGDTVIDTPLRGFLPILGVIGVSWLIVALSMCLVKSWKNIPLALGTLLLGYGLTHVSWTQPSDETYQVTLIQGNIPQLLKWDPKEADAHFRAYYQLSKNAPPSDIIIWPEASLPIPLPYGQPYLNALQDLSKKNNSAFLIGELYTDDNDYFLNSAQVVGDGFGRYDKRHLVPFGEYLPFYQTLGPILENLRLPTPSTVPGKPTQSLLTLKNWQAAVMICYEIAFPRLTLDTAKDSDILITISNDTWFGHSIGPAQHFQIARTRAIESGRYLLRATNNGITAFVGPDGKVLAQAPQFIATTLTHEISGMQGRTPLMIYGHLGVLLVALGLIVWSRLISHPKGIHPYEKS